MFGRRIRTIFAIAKIKRPVKPAPLTSVVIFDILDVAMKKEKLEVVRGTGNVFRDLGHKNADVEQFKAILAAEIIKALDRERLTVRGAHGRTGIAAADFSRIRNAQLGRFTVDRLMSIINRLGSRIVVKVRIRPVESAARGQGVRMGGGRVESARQQRDQK
jgi:predicted XRE-type DNA-binding protein